MPKFSVGDKVIFHDQLATITEVHYYLPTRTGKKKMIWYSVQYDGFRAQYAVSQKTNSLKKAKVA